MQPLSTRHREELGITPTRPVWWNIHYKTGNSFSSLDGTWDSQAFSVVRDGATLSFSKKDIESVSILHQGVETLFLPPSPRKLFAFTRLSASASAFDPDPDVADSLWEQQSTFWLYTTFGYLLPDYRVLCSCTPQGYVQQIEPRSTPLSF